MKITELRQDSTTEKWMRNLKPKRNTELAYTQALAAYTESSGLTPRELIAEADQEEVNQVRMRDRKIKDRLINFRSSMVDQELSDLTIRGRMGAVRSFYQSFDIELPKLQGERRRARVKEENTGIPTKEDLQAVLKVCDPLEKAIMLTGVSSGLSSVEIQNLTISQFKIGYDHKTEITTLKIQRTKTGVEFITFLSPECSRAIWEYLEYRSREAKAATWQRKRQLLKQRIISDDGYLFILRQINDDYLQTPDEEKRKLSGNVVQKMFRAMSAKAKKDTKARTYNIVRSHTMRKFFNSTLLNKGCDSFHVEFFMGHELDNTRAAYFRASPEELKGIYQKFVPYLTIQKENSIEENPEFKKLNEEVQNLKGENEKLKLDRFENEAIKKLKEDLEELRKAQKEKEELESIFMDIAAGEFSELNQHEDWDTKYAEHEKRMKADPVYRKKYLEFELPFIQETFGNGLGKELEERNKKDREEHKKLRDTENRLYNTLTDTKTLADEL